MTVKELLSRYPAVVRFLLKRNLSCAGCATEAFHTLDDVARCHGLGLQVLMSELQATLHAGWPQPAGGPRRPRRIRFVNASMLRECAPLDISEEDVLGAMKALHGFIDITPADFREIYRAAYVLAKQRVLQALKARDVMTAPVHTVAPEMDLIATAKLLAEHGISGAPVVDREGKVAGIISAKDFLARMGAGRSGAFMQVVVQCLTEKGCVVTPLRHRTAGDIMSAPAVTAAAESSVAEIAALLTEKQINRLPIVAGDGRLVGIVTRSDLVNAYCMLG